MNKFAYNINRRRLKVVSVLLVSVVFIVMSCVEDSTVTVDAPNLNKGSDEHSKNLPAQLNESSEVINEVFGDHSETLASPPSESEKNTLINKAVEILKKCHENRTVYNAETMTCDGSSKNLVAAGYACTDSLFTKDGYTVSSIYPIKGCDEAGGEEIQVLAECFNPSSGFPSIIKVCLNTSTLKFTRFSTAFKK